jgi:hypothetical protein
MMTEEEESIRAGLRWLVAHVPLDMLVTLGATERVRLDEATIRAGAEGTLMIARESLVRLAKLHQYLATMGWFNREMEIMTWVRDHRYELSLLQHVTDLDKFEMRLYSLTSPFMQQPGHISCQSRSGGGRA